MHLHLWVANLARHIFTFPGRGVWLLVLIFLVTCSHTLELVNSTHPCPGVDQDFGDFLYFLRQEALQWDVFFANYTQQANNVTIAAVHTSPPLTSKSNSLTFTEGTQLVLVDRNNNYTSTSFIRNSIALPTPTTKFERNSDGTRITRLTLSDFFADTIFTTVVAYPTQYVHYYMRYGRNTAPRNVTSLSNFRPPTLIRTSPQNPIPTPIPTPMLFDPQGLYATPTLQKRADRSHSYPGGCPDVQFEPSNINIQYPVDLVGKDLITLITIVSTSYITIGEATGDPNNGLDETKTIAEFGPPNNPIPPAEFTTGEPANTGIEKPGPDLGSIIESILAPSQPRVTPADANSKGNAVTGMPPANKPFDEPFLAVSAVVSSFGAVFSFGNSVYTAGTAGLALGTTVLRVGNPAFTTRNKVISIGTSYIYIAESGITSIIPYSNLPASDSANLLNTIIPTPIHNGPVLDFTILINNGVTFIKDGTTFQISGPAAIIKAASYTTTIPFSLLSSYLNTKLPIPTPSPGIPVPMFNDMPVTPLPSALIIGTMKLYPNSRVTINDKKLHISGSDVVIEDPFITTIIPLSNFAVQAKVTGSSPKPTSVALSAHSATQTKKGAPVKSLEGNGVSATASASKKSGVEGGWRGDFWIWHFWVALVVIMVGSVLGWC